jgi:F0F1-type ATP synthase gamma subunit
MNTGINYKKAKKRYNVPVIGHFANRSIRFNSINEAESFTGISYTLIFEACIGKIYKARNVYWEFENGAHYIKYKAHYIRVQRQLEEQVGHSHGKKQKELEANPES